MIRQPSPGRAGLTLLEVVVAMAIFLISVVAILQLVLMGGERAMDVRLQTRTSMRCQSKLAEVMIGAQAMTPTGYTDFPDGLDKDLQWQLDVKEVPSVADLWLVTVSVKADLPTGKTVESKVSQMVVDPSKRGTTFDQ